MADVFTIRPLLLCGGAGSGCVGEARTRALLSPTSRVHTSSRCLQISPLRPLVPWSKNKSSFYLHEMEVHRLNVALPLWQRLLTSLQTPRRPPHLAAGPQARVSGATELPLSQATVAPHGTAGASGNVWNWICTLCVTQPERQMCVWGRERERQRDRERERESTTVSIYV